jgi:hypothetical protein
VCWHKQWYLAHQVRKTVASLLPVNCNSKPILSIPVPSHSYTRLRICNHSSSNSLIDFFNTFISNQNYSDSIS